MVDYLEDLKNLIVKQFGIDPENIEEDSSLEADLNITELDLEDLIETIQDKYQIQIPPEKVSIFSSQVLDKIRSLPQRVQGFFTCFCIIPPWLNV